MEWRNFFTPYFLFTLYFFFCAFRFRDNLPGFGLHGFLLVTWAYLSRKSLDVLSPHSSSQMPPLFQVHSLDPPTLLPSNLKKPKSRCQLKEYIGRRTKSATSTGQIERFPPPCSKARARTKKKKHRTLRRTDHKNRKKHTTDGIPRWSPTLVLVARFSAYVWQSGRDAQFSLTCGRMYWYFHVFLQDTDAS